MASARRESSAQDVETAIALMRNSASCIQYDSESESDSEDENVFLTLGWLDGAQFQGHSLRRERNAAAVASACKCRDI